jgi:large subunit ribosomal protein L13
VQKTSHLKTSEVKPRWWIADATGQTLGRLATRLATVLQGKHRPDYTPHVDTGDYVVVTNAEKIAVTGKKLSQKEYRRYTGYLGGLKTEPLGSLLARKPERVIELAVQRMLPKGRLGRRMRLKLKVYAGPAHPHAAQKPEPLAVQAGGDWRRT